MLLIKSHQLPKAYGQLNKKLNEQFNKLKYAAVTALDARSIPKELLKSSGPKASMFFVVDAQPWP